MNSKMTTKAPQNQSFYMKIQFQNDETIFFGFLMSPVQKEVYLELPKRYDSKFFSMVLYLTNSIIQKNCKSFLF